MSTPVTPPKAKGLSIQRLRTLILVALVIGLSAYTAVMFTLVQHLSERFGPQVRADLEWRALRGAQELALTADLGLAVSDGAMVKESFGAYAKSSDVQAIVAIDAAGKIVAQHGTVAAPMSLFGGKAGALSSGDGYLASWAPAVIEGNEVGKVAVAVSTQRLTDGQALLDNVSSTTVIAGGAGLLMGVIVILFFTRAVAQRDHQLKDYAHNLEKKVDERTSELDARNKGMRLVLDNVAQGFLTTNLAGELAAERSAVVDRWFGAPAAGTSFGACIGQFDENFGVWFDLSMESLRDGLTPLELCMYQMPKRFAKGDQRFDVAYSPILEGETPVSMLIIVTDVTAQIAHEAEQREQRELVAMFQRIASDREGFEEFLTDANGLVDQLATPTDPVIEKRVVHTLKGNCAVFGMEAFAEICHHVESELAETGGALSEAQRARVLDGWRAVVVKISRLLGPAQREVVEVEHADLVRLIGKAQQGASGRELAAVMTSWMHEPIARRLHRLGDHATGLARRLGKGELRVAVEDPSQVRLNGAQWSAFWGSTVHAVRNAIDHGLETPDARVAAGKAPEGTLTLSAERGPDRLTITIADDGAGIQWEAVRAKLTRIGLPAASHEDLVAGLFADGVSTREQASETSGRGVGLAALREAVLALGGTIQVRSTLGAGTSFVFTFPYVDPQVMPIRPPSQPLRRMA